MPRLALRALKLSYFRSHRAAHLQLDARPVALYGANGAGKTNILEAVSLLSPGRGLRRATPADMARAPERIGWKVAAEMESLVDLHEVATSAQGDASRLVEIDGKPAPQVALGRIARITWLVPAMDRLWTEGAAERRRFLDRLVLGFDPSHAEAVLGYEKAMRERNRLLRDQSRDAGWYAALEGQMADHGARITAARLACLDRLAAAQGGARTAFPAADLTLLDGDVPATAPATDDLAQALAASRPADLRAGRTLVGPHRADLRAIYAAKGIEARNASTGEQKALLVSLVLASARALAEDFGAPPILLLDEVAAHLDEARRAALFDEICALGAQAWMTGTGPELFDALGDRASYVEVSEADGLSHLEQKGMP
ncbi:DNA replication/repair protein RecF [Oceanomicrobium pacificus]|uniref:DNA replication and repair protein RecF n=1 Tax=Oceanomicrobium pacificus TaxID=2692916 RepID=A0A6B0TK32_9RHOB|nr:DNA replication/repair protein RecF [Oceanomicrobium pacificus]MXU64860.1 DNA replication/repair protein RecF [Oceanomicrobium pacificus]